MTGGPEECAVFPLSSLRYYKESDPGLWINVDKNTGELKVANTIDRESKFVQDGIYNITMKAVDASKWLGTCCTLRVHTENITSTNISQVHPTLMDKDTTAFNTVLLPIFFINI